MFQVSAGGASTSGHVSPTSEDLRLQTMRRILAEANLAPVSGLWS